MSLEVEKTENEIIIRPIGEFNHTIQEEFQAAYENESPDLKYVLDMNKVTWIDSAALGMMVKLQAHTGRQFDTQIINSSPKLRALLSQAHFGDMFLIL
ncbi:MAG: STAS domain-containing protein [Magnetococcales bacterium]|nr:STAS domain-containing protein [Magnetococcales bacterium]